MADREMTTQEMEDFLSEPQLAHIATVRANGAPHLAPLWYEYADGKVWIITDDRSVKVRNIRHNPRVVVSVASNDEPYRYVLVEGVAEVAYEGVGERIRSICIRYWGEERGAAFANEIGEGGGTVVLVITPSRTITWLHGHDG